MGGMRPCSEVEEDGSLDLSHGDSRIDSDVRLRGDSMSKFMGSTSASSKSSIVGMECPLRRRSVERVRGLVTIGCFGVGLTEDDEDDAATGSNDAVPIRCPLTVSPPLAVCPPVRLFVNPSRDCPMGPGPPTTVPLPS